MGFYHIKLKMNEVTYELYVGIITNKLLLLIAELVNQWNIDWHMLSLNGDNFSNMSDQLKAALQGCNITEIYKILSNDAVLMSW